jgi:hypothetical protein
MHNSLSVAEYRARYLARYQSGIIVYASNMKVTAESRHMEVDFEN